MSASPCRFSPRWRDRRSRIPAGAAKVAAEAAKLYAAGDYLRAAHRFDDAWAADPLPAYRFNAAQAYRLGDDCEDAANRYENFLDVAHDAQNLDQVRKYLDDQRACAKDRALVVPPTPPKPTPTPPAEKRAVVVVPPPLPPPESGKQLRFRRFAIGTAAVGAVFVVLGVNEWTNVMRYDTAQSGCNTPSSQTGPCTAAQAQIIDRGGDRASQHMETEFILGGAALAGGAVLWMLGRDPERASITPTAGGAMFSTRFRF